VHRIVKRFYQVTNKRDATKQIANRHRREAAVRHRSFDASGVKQNWKEIPAELHHHISASKNNPLPLAAFVRADPQDTAKKVCLSSRVWDVLLTTRVP
jgi:hypothetical protein